MTKDKVGYFNFGNDFKGYGIDNYEELFVFFGTTYLQWKKDPGFSGGMFEGFDGLTGEGGAWFWVPGDCKLDPDPDPDGAYFDEYKNPFEEKKTKEEEKDLEELRKVPPFKDTYYAVRSEVDGIWATCTVETGIKPGDILLSHHKCDNFISKLTLSWPTHAGIALNERWAADADARGDKNAVDYITLMNFFAQKSRTRTWNNAKKCYEPDWPDDDHLTPTGGAVYRYMGKPGDDQEKIERVCRKAAKWAKGQTGNQYVFSLKSSRIIAKKKGLAKFKKGSKIVEKEFDVQGKAVDEKGQRATRYSKSKDKRVETESHSIYCAELVWRAYRKAGVNIVDPKKLANLFEDSSHGVAAVLGWNLRNEDWSFDDIDELADEKKDEIDQAWNDLKAKKKLEKLRGLGPVIQKSLIWECLRNARGGIQYLPASIVRKILIAIIKKKSSAYFCAPYQLAKSKLTKRIARRPYVEAKYEKIKVIDFRGKNIHPYKVLKAVSDVSDNVDDDAWKKFEKEKGKELELSLEKPWHDSKGEPDAPELKLDADEPDETYNVEVDFKGPQPKPPFMS